MKKKKIVLRILVSPFLLGLLVLSHLYMGIEKWIMFLRFGAEYITYDKNSITMINDVYQIVKEKYKPNEL